MTYVYGSDNILERFPVQSLPELDQIGPYPAADHDLRTATSWTLHLRVLPSRVLDLAVRVLATGAECLTGQYCGGDSFAEWREPYSVRTAAIYGQPGAALHIYLHAPDLAAAVRSARALCEELSSFAGPAWLVAENVTLSTAGDWAEQAQVWQATRQGEQ